MKTAVRRGITPVVAIALLLGMTVAASGGAYSFISQAQQSAQQDASTALATEVAVRSLRCDDATVEATLKNTGDTSLSDTALTAYLYTDGTLVTTDEVDVSAADVLQPNGLTTVSLPFILDPGTRYTVELRFPQDEVTTEDTCQARVASLRAHWDFETKAPGTVTDAARNHDGTFYNNEKDGTLTNFDFDATSGWTEGKIGSALFFDGDSGQEYVDIGDQSALELGTTDITISAWVRTDDPSDGRQMIVSKSNDAEFYSGYDIRLDSGTPMIGVHNTTEDDSTNIHRIRVAGSTAITDTDWHHVVGVIDRASQAGRIYLDGQDVTGSVVGGLQPGQSIANSEPTYIGVQADQGHHWGGSASGRLDEVRIFSRALSDSEVSALYGGAVNRSGLVAEYTFDEGNGTTAHDTSKWVAGKVDDYALDFDGADDHVNITGGVGMSGASAFTATAWVYTGDWVEFLDSEGRFQIRYQTSPNTFQFVTDFQGAGSTTIVSSEALADDTWHFVSLSYDGTDLTAYVDGEQVGQTSIGADQVASSTADLVLGGRGNMQYFFDRKLDDVRIYDTGLTGDQVAALYDATR